MQALKARTRDALTAHLSSGAGSTPQATATPQAVSSARPGSSAGAITPRPTVASNSSSNSIPRNGVPSNNGSAASQAQSPIDGALPAAQNDGSSRPTTPHIPPSGTPKPRLPSLSSVLQAHSDRRADNTLRPIISPGVTPPAHLPPLPPAKYVYPVNNPGIAPRYATNGSSMLPASAPGPRNPPTTSSNTPGVAGNSNHIPVATAVPTPPSRPPPPVHSTSTTSARQVISSSNNGVATRNPITGSSAPRIAGPGQVLPPIATTAAPTAPKPSAGNAAVSASKTMPTASNTTRPVTSGNTSTVPRINGTEQATASSGSKTVPASNTAVNRPIAPKPSAPASVPAPARLVVGAPPVAGQPSSESSRPLKRTADQMLDASARTAESQNGKNGENETVGSSSGSGNGNGSRSAKIVTYGKSGGSMNRVAIERLHSDVTAATESGVAASRPGNSADVGAGSERAKKRRKVGNGGDDVRSNGQEGGMGTKTVAKGDTAASRVVNGNVDQGRDKDRDGDVNMDAQGQVSEPPRRSLVRLNINGKGSGKKHVDADGDVDMDAREGRPEGGDEMRVWDEIVSELCMNNDIALSAVC